MLRQLPVEGDGVCGKLSQVFGAAVPVDRDKSESQKECQRKRVRERKGQNDSFYLCENLKAFSLSKSLKDVLSQPQMHRQCMMR